MIEKVKNAGVIGAGGAGFPTHIKIAAEVEIVIANGAECEPLLSTDRYLMENNAREIIEGLQLAARATKADKVYLALKRKYKQAVSALEKALEETGYDIEIYLMDNYYPAGDEVDMVQNVTGRIVPEGGIPLDVDCVVTNVNTLLNLYRAVENNTPVTRRWLTVCGELSEPYIAAVPVGISAGELVAAGKPTTDDYLLVSGGPMTGNIVDGEHRITKACGGIIVLPPDNRTAVKKSRDTSTVYRRGQSMCDQCFECSIVCPRNLLGHALKPHEIMRSLFISPEQSQVDLTMAYLCCECGLCDMFACPMDLSPRDMLVQLREELQEAGIENPHHEKNTELHPEREYRRINADRLTIRLGLDKYDLHDFPVKEITTDKVRIPLSQHVGAPSQPVVEKGEAVKEGDLIADIPPETLGAKIHASIDGRVTDITENHIEISAED